MLSSSPSSPLRREDLRLPWLRRCMTEVAVVCGGSLTRKHFISSAVWGGLRRGVALWGLSSRSMPSTPIGIRYFSERPHGHKLKRAPRLVLRGPRQTRKQTAEKVPAHVKAMVAIAACFVGGAAYFLMSNAFNPTIYTPPVPELDRKNLGLSPDEFVKLLREGDKVKILSADLSHLRAKIVSLDEEAGRAEDCQQSLSGAVDDNSDMGALLPHVIVAGPEILAGLGRGAPNEFIASRTSSVPWQWFASSSAKTKNVLVIFNPSQLDDQLIRLNWANLVDVYVDRIFPGEEFEELRKAILVHSTALKSLEDSLLDGSNGDLAPLNAKDYLEKSSKDLESTKRILLSYTGIINKRNDVSQKLKGPGYLIQDRPLNTLNNLSHIDMDDLLATK
eukprot:CAMPEP_0114494514 /NCGR_PEP_ID=MMETSP0109-20121206/4694_1 /TAXON_ID=29199 /ORGANISM="Chlorarachnion reptans, Strain CCCM449" /LENGTH=389 /DNA_ID=CAMNT_0001671559 /DNA_START=107 /DNA_END=1276 /DNA_ORIENTATION=-